MLEEKENIVCIDKYAEEGAYNNIDISTTEVFNIEPVVESSGSNQNDPESARQNRTVVRNAQMSNREIRKIDYLPFPDNVKLYVDGDFDKRWAISVGYNYNGQYVNAGASRVYKLIQYKGTQATSGALKIDTSALDLTFKKVRERVQKSYEEGKSYDYKNYLPITMFAHKQGSQSGGIIEMQDGTGAVMDISRRRYDYKLHYFGDFADEIWNISNQSTVMSGRIITNKIKSFTNDPNEDTLILCIIDKYIQGQLFTEEDMLDKYKTPAWDEWLNKFDKKSQEYILAWIWALVYQNSNNTEILWIRSEGGDGKTTFVNALTKGLSKLMVFGNEGLSEDKFHATITNSTSDGLKNTFITSQVYDKRLVYIPECKNPNILRSSFIHQLSGSEDISVNQKFEKVFTIKPQANVLICSNDYPKVDNQANELRRLLFVSPRDDYEHKHKKDDTFEGKLVNEIDTLLYKCKFYYDRCIERGKGYIQPPEETLEWISNQGVMIDSSDGNYDLLFTKGEDRDKITLKEIQRAMEYANQGLKGKIKFNFDQRAVSVYFKEAFGISRMTTTKRDSNGKHAKAYQGIKLRPYVEIDTILENQTNNSYNMPQYEGDYPDLLE